METFARVASRDSLFALRRERFDAAQENRSAGVCRCGDGSIAARTRHAWRDQQACGVGADRGLARWHPFGRARRTRLSASDDVQGSASAALAWALGPAAGS